MGLSWKKVGDFIRGCSCIRVNLYAIVPFTVAVLFFTFSGHDLDKTLGISFAIGGITVAMVLFSYVVAITKACHEKERLKHLLLIHVVYVPFTCLFWGIVYVVHLFGALAIWGLIRDMLGHPLTLKFF